MRGFAVAALLLALSPARCSKQAVDTSGEKSAGQQSDEPGAVRPSGDRRAGQEPPTKPTEPAPGEHNVSAPGIPEGYDAFEKQDLRVGAWRFYMIVERADSPSIHEANWPVHAGEGKPGPEGLAEFLADPDVTGNLGATEPARLATQVAMFLVEGDSRQSALFKVIREPGKDAPGFEAQLDRLHPPEVEVQGDRLTIRAWLMRDGYLRRMVVSRTPGKPPEINMSELLTR